MVNHKKRVTLNTIALIVFMQNPVYADQTLIDPMTLGQDAQPLDPRIEERSVLVDAATRLSIHQKIVLMEISLCGRSSTTRSPMKRLYALEKELPDDGLVTSQETVPGKLAALMQKAPPSDELVEFVISRSANGVVSADETIPWVNTTWQKVSLIELAALGKVNGGHLKDRIAKLQKSVLLKKEYVQQDVDEQISELLLATRPSEELIAQVCDSQRNSQTPLTFLAGLSPGRMIARGARSLGRKSSAAAEKTGRGLGRLLSSPTLWMAVIGGATLYGAYLLSKSNSTSRTSSGERACVGELACDKCTNCFYCGHCKNSTNPCGVWLRTRGVLR